MSFKKEVINDQKQPIKPKTFDYRLIQRACLIIVLLGAITAMVLASRGYMGRWRAATYYSSAALIGIALLFGIYCGKRKKALFQKPTPIFSPTSVVRGSNESDTKSVPVSEPSPPSPILSSGSASRKSSEESLDEELVVLPEEITSEEPCSTLVEEIPFHRPLTPPFSPDLVSKSPDELDIKSVPVSQPTPPSPIKQKKAASPKAAALETPLRGPLVSSLSRQLQSPSPAAAEYRPFWWQLASRAPLMRNFGGCSHPQHLLSLQYLLNDYVGGRGQADGDFNLDVCVNFFKYYLNLYLEIWPEDLEAIEIQKALSAYIYNSNKDVPLAEVAAGIWQQLEEKRYVTMEGGISGLDAGHALFYEFILKEDNTVSFRVTNSGLGLSYHLEGSIEHSYYRTLLFQGASLEELKRGPFLELLLSCKRPRPSPDRLKEHCILPEKFSSIYDLYTILFYSWPGSKEIVSQNPGKQQRAESCSMQALLKWIKGSFDRTQQPWITLWIKLAGLSDYLYNAPEPSSQFIRDSLRKISSHIDKMDQQLPIPNALLKVWQDLSRRAEAKISETLIFEAKRRWTEALSAEKGWGLEAFQLAQLDEIEGRESPLRVPATYNYSHVFPSEAAPLEHLPKLAEKSIAPIFDEMVYRMNLARLMPYCEEWEALGLSRGSVNELATLVQLFFYTSKDAPSVHVPDSFCADLLNIWMGVYLQAKREGKISKEVLLEWMEGAALLVNTYTREYRFDSPESREKWNKLGRLILHEKEELLQELSVSRYEPPPSYWTVYRRRFKAYGGWAPFGIELMEKKVHYSPYIGEFAEIPAMANFAYRILNECASLYPKGVKWEDNEIPHDRKLAYIFHANEKIWDHVCSDGRERLARVQKTVSAFGCRLLEVVPYYDLLRGGLTALFVLTDSCLSKTGGSRKRGLIATHPSLEDITTHKGDYPHPLIDTLGRLHTTRFDPEGTPAECTLPITQAQFLDLSDLNQRVYEILLEQKRHFPFMTVSEEKQLLIFVQKEGATRLTEMLIFWKKSLYKLSRTEYQSVFEHLLFGMEGGKWLERLLAQNPLAVEILFRFFKTSYKEILQRGPSTQAAAAALFHSHLRLFQQTYHLPGGEKRIKQLLRSWDLLIEEGKSNPILGNALGQAVFAALPTLEFIHKEFLQEERVIELLTITCLLECIPGNYTQKAYSQLQLHYGYFSFKTLLARSGESTRFLQEAGRRVFGEKCTGPCHWDADNNRVYLGPLLEINLADRLIERGSESSMKLIPEKYRNYEFKRFFHKQTFFAHRRREGDKEIYAFSWRRASYELHIDSITEKQEIYKKFGENFYKLLGESKLKLDHDHYFNSKHTLWKTEEGESLLEHTATQEIVAVGKGKEFYRCQKSEVFEEQLATFEGESPMRSLFERLSIPVIVWASRGHISRIELPTLSLQFKVDEQGELYPINAPGLYGFKVAKKQYLPFLKNFQSALILENSKGQKKVVLPVLSFKKASKYIPYKESPVTSNQHNSYEGPLVALTFDIDAKGEPKLSPHKKHQAATAWLVSLYLRTQKYDQALDLLHQTQLLSQHSIQELTRTIVKRAVEEEKDHHPHAAALRLKLRVWIKEIKGVFNNEEEIRNRAKGDLDLYRNLRNAHGRFALTQKEMEQCILHQGKDFFDQGRGDPQWGELKGACKWSIIRTLPDLSREIRKQIVDSETPLPALSLTAPGEEFILNFLHHYRIMRSGSSQEKKALLSHLHFTYNDSSSLIAVLSRVLSRVAQGQDPVDLCELFKLEDEEGFRKQFNQYLGNITQDEEVLYPASSSFDFYNRHLRFSSHHGVHNPKQARVAKYINTYMYLPLHLTFREREPDLCRSLERNLLASIPCNYDSEKHAAERLSRWAAEKTEALQEECEQECVAKVQRGAEKLQREFAGASTTKEVVRPELVDTVNKNYEVEIRRRTGALQEKEKNILEMANDLHDHHQYHWERGRELRKPFDMDILLIALGRRDLTTIKNSNPGLSDQEIQEIMQAVAEYAYDKRELQQLIRAQKSLREDPEGYLPIARATMAYSPEKYPELLVCEVLFDLILREEQIRVVEALLKGELSLEEAMTGFGKTRVVLPLWILLKAQEKLAIFIAPTNLFEDQELYLQDLLKKAYHFFGTTIEFSRESPSKPEDIRAITEEMRRAEQLRRPVFMSVKTAANLTVLKPKELLERKQDLQAFRELNRYLSSRAAVFGDEPHLLWDDRKGMNYALGMAEQIAPERLEFEVELYQKLIILVMNKGYQIECLGQKKKDSFLTEESYYKEILPSLIAEILPDASKKELEYLEGRLPFPIQKRFEIELRSYESEERAIRIKTLHDQLYHYLPHTLLKRSCDEHYALKDPEKERFAIPVANMRDPIIGNEFVDIDPLLNYTMQANLKTPFSLEYITCYVEKLQREATEEADKRAIAFTNTRAYRDFTSIIRGMEPPPSFITIKQEDLLRLCAHINENFEAKLSLILLDVLPQIRYFPEKVASTPHLLVPRFHTVVGASGTLSMKHFPHGFKVNVDETAMVRTLVALLKYDDPIIELPSESTHLIQSAAQYEELSEASVIIEVGALRDYNDLTKVAEETLHAYPKFNGFATFDQAGHPIVMPRNSKQWVQEATCGIARSELFWFYGQKDITGRDEKLDPKAIAMILVNQHTTLTQFVQGVGRMRDILRKQKARIVMDSETSFHMRRALGKLKQPNPLVFLDCLDYFIGEEARGNGVANFRSLPLQVDALIENVIWNEIWKRDTLSVNDMQNLRNYVVQATEDHPLYRPSFRLHSVQREVALKELKTRFTEKIQGINSSKKWPLSQIDLKKMLEMFDKVEQQMTYPREVNLNCGLDASEAGEVMAEQSVAQQQEQEQEEEVLADHEVESEQMVDVSFLSGRSPLPRVHEIKPHPLERLFNHKYLQEFLPLFGGVHFLISENAFCTFTGDSNESPGWVNGYVKPLHYIAQLHDHSFVLIDTDEAATILQHPQSVQLLWLVDHGLLAGKGKVPPMMEVQVKGLNGELEFTREQQELFTQWISEELRPLFERFTRKCKGIRSGAVAS